MEYRILHEVLLLLATTVVAVVVFRRLKLPTILAYLFVGMMVGPHGLGWISNTEDIRLLAEFGVVFLLFTIGLEFSLPLLLAMKELVLGLGVTQVVVTAAITGGIAWLLGVPLPAAFAVGGILAMSSTAIVSKQLAEQTELHSRHGRQSIAILLFQDLAVVPFMLLIPVLGSGASDFVWLSLAWIMVKGTLVFFALIAAGRWLLRPLLRIVAALRSKESFMLTILLVVLGAAWVTHETGLSLALGAFLTGMMVSETEYRHQVEADIRPFRDVLLGLFFVTVGMLLDISALAQLWYWVLLLLVAVIGVKTCVVMGLSLLGRSDPGVALRTGLTLAHGGEFSFVLISLSLASGLLEPDVTQLLLMVLVASMFIAPLLIRSSYTMAKRAFPVSYAGSFRRMVQDAWDGSSALEGHVVICGYGPFGQHVGYFLEKEGFKFTALDLDPLRVQEAHQAGERVFYGDSTRKEMLLAAGLEKARVLVVSYRTLSTALKILDNVRQLRPNLPVLARTREAGNERLLKERGATEVFPEMLETSLSLSSHLMSLMGVPAVRALQLVKDVRGRHYLPLLRIFQGNQPLPLSPEDGSRERLHPVTLPSGTFAVGRTINELDFEAAKVVLAALKRDGNRDLRPDPLSRLQAGDTLILYGAPEDLEHVKRSLLRR